MKIKDILTALAFTLPAITLLAQEGDRPLPPGGPGHRPPPPPIIAALDANHDGVIDAGEIANASNALKTLDKNGDGKLTMDELRPPRPEGGHPGGGPDHPPGPPSGEN